MQQAERKTKKNIRSNDSFSSFSSARSGKRLAKASSGFFVNRVESSANVSQDASLNEEKSEKSSARKKKKQAKLM